MNRTDFEGWIPGRIHWMPGGPTVEWLYLGTDRLSDPFFEATMRRQLDRPFRALFRRQTTMEELVEHAEQAPDIRPAGFILHWSRCGSTLITQMLAASPANLVISEAGCIEDLIWAGAWNRSLTVEAMARWLRALIRILGQPRAGETRYFVKFEPLQTLALPLIRAAFPETPWIFVYRDPLEILVSLARSTPFFAMPGASVAGFFPLPPGQSAQMDPADYAARVLNRIGSAAAARLESGDGVAVHYTELPDAVFSRIAGHFRCSWTSGERDAMQTAARRDAKRPSSRFESDSERKRREATDVQRRFSTEWLDGVYSRLEAIRESRSAHNAS